MLRIKRGWRSGVRWARRTSPTRPKKMTPAVAARRWCSSALRGGCLFERCDPGDEIGNLMFERIGAPLLLLQFVQEQRRQQVILHAFSAAVLAVRDQFRKHAC